MSQPVLLFDVIETLFSLSPLTGRLRAFGLTERHGDLFLAQLLRKGGGRGVWIERGDHRYHLLMGTPLGYAKTLTQAVNTALKQE